MNRILCSIVPCLAAVLLSCNATVVNFSATYKMDKAPSTCAIVVPLKIGVYYEGNVENEFGKGDKKVLIAEYFRKQLRNEIAQQTVFQQVYVSSISKEFHQQVINVKTGKGTKTLFVPAPNEKIECQGQIPDVVVFLDEVEISSHLEMSGSPGFSAGGFMYGPSFSSSKNLVVMGKFMIYDNRKSELVSHGFIEIVDKNSFAVSMEDWIDVLAKTASTLTGSTPFRRMVN